MSATGSIYSSLASISVEKEELEEESLEADSVLQGELQHIATLAHEKQTKVSSITCAL